MNKLISVFIRVSLVILLLLLPMPVPVPDKEYFEQFKNQNLSYAWRFNYFLDSGGHTYNQSYFELRRYRVFDWLRAAIDKSSDITSYELQYKHEEGHIWLFQFFVVNSSEEWESLVKHAPDEDAVWNEVEHLCGKGRLYDLYISSLSEGLPDYYAISNSAENITRPYISFLSTREKDHCKFFKYGHGRRFVEFLVSNYGETLIEIAKKSGSPEQYMQYKSYLIKSGPTGI